MRKVALLAILLLASHWTMANVAASGWCEVGAQAVVTSGISSSSKFQASYPQCLITVYPTGSSTPVPSNQIYSNNLGSPTVLGNPFTANTNGWWQAYAANGRYDIVLSGAGFPTPFTISDVVLFDPATGNVATATHALNLLSDLATQSAAAPNTVCTSSGPIDIVACYAADPTGATDSTTKIQSAVTAANASGRSIYLPAGTYLVKGSSSCLISTLVSINGEGESSALWVDPTTGATTDIVCVTPVAAESRLVRLTNFAIRSTSGTPGRYGIRLDGTTQPVKDFIVENVHVKGTGSQSLYINGPVYTGTVRNNWFENCILLNSAYDSIHIENNTINGNCTGISGSFYPGASADTITGNNITSLQGGINLSSAFRPVIENNYIETLSGYNTAIPCIALGSDHTNGVVEPRLIGNFISCALQANTDALSFDKVTFPMLAFNTIYSAGSGVPLRTTALTAYIMGGNNSCSPVCNVTGSGTLLNFADQGNESIYNLLMLGATSGYTTLVPAAIASGTLLLPAKIGNFTLATTADNVASATALAATPGGATGQAACWKASGVLGYCSTTPTSGACTCN
jgi:hypothetical protein